MTPNPGTALRTLLLSALGCLAFAGGAFAHGSAHAVHADADSVQDTALAAPAEIVDCTLESGEAAQCARYVVKHQPDDLRIGPFCPATIEDEGGIWHWDGDEAGLYRIDGDFLRMLADQGYTFFDESGEVYSFDIRTEGPTEANECIQATADPEVEMTVLIPVDPVMAETPSDLGTVAKVGIALDGVPIFADAPSVLDTGHMPALDTCGGHIDPGGWYHWHATATDLDAIYDAEEVHAACANVEQDPTAQFGFAFDGFAMFGTLEHDGTTPDGLDECGGHMGPTTEDGEPVYHYHARDSFPNLPTCLVGSVARDNFSTTAAGGIGSASGNGGHGGHGGQPDFDPIARTLGVDADLLRETLDAAGGPTADMNAVAETLSVTPDALEAAMPRPGH
ncbi:YHYH protein [Paracoccus sp. 1_MG-2023]|uniref:YHYH protein n=1 Tax=unclassified Paracoccus (in: a-proteobacteria) TaxID=2688777 RepID=UPI001C0820B2|nr:MULTISPECIES: YHYH protein [unclassified Paracoccus (in: a-proteobacteria)]MBU2957857.1 YHYH protein [Paracoccus sp. C2R09]MDO6667295.1 YHYH protein [Paracoccus sp. 1_MG-2023]